MNMRMNKRLNTTAEGGFTLIELIVVIVILGILAATALPKFASLGGDARMASLQAAKGSLSSVVAMAHGKYLINPSVAPSFDGTTLGMSNGYPKADTTLFAAAGLSSDYVQVGGAGAQVNATANTPLVTSTQTAFIPSSLSGKVGGLDCYVIYTEAASGGTPTVAMSPTITADKCN